MFLNGFLFILRIFRFLGVGKEVIWYIQFGFGIILSVSVLGELLESGVVGKWYFWKFSFFILGNGSDDSFVGCVREIEQLLVLLSLFQLVVKCGKVMGDLFILFQSFFYVSLIKNFVLICCRILFLISYFFCKIFLFLREEVI